MRYKIWICAAMMMCIGNVLGPKGGRESEERADARKRDEIISKINEINQHPNLDFNIGAYAYSGGTTIEINIFPRNSDQKTKKGTVHVIGGTGFTFKDTEPVTYHVDVVQTDILKKGLRNLTTDENTLLEVVPRNEARSGAPRLRFTAKKGSPNKLAISLVK